MNKDKKMENDMEYQEILKNVKKQFEIRRQRSEYNRRYYQEHREQKRRYYQEHGDEIRERQRANYFRKTHIYWGEPMEILPIKDMDLGR